MSSCPCDTMLLDPSRFLLFWFESLHGDVSIIIYYYYYYYLLLKNIFNIEGVRILVCALLPFEALFHMCVSLFHFFLSPIDYLP